MTKKLLLLAAALTVAVPATALADGWHGEGHGRWRGRGDDWHGGWGGPRAYVYAPPPPVYVAPPAYYAPPPVYYAPPPVFYAPPSLFLGFSFR